VQGTSLVVYPFASLTDDVPESCPRLLINREVAGEIPEEMRALGYKNGLWFGEGNVRDAKFLGDCDDGVARLAEHLGWHEELAALVGERYASNAAGAVETAQRAADAVGEVAAQPSERESSLGSGGERGGEGGELAEPTRVSFDARSGVHPSTGGTPDERGDAEADQLAGQLSSVHLQEDQAARK
jgi:hypothetical protein